MMPNDRLVSRRLFLATPLVALLALGVISLGATPAHADLSKKVIAAFKGKVLVTTEPLVMSGDDKTTIAQFKKRALTQVQGAEGSDQVWTWNFMYTAFLKGTGATSLKLEFYNGTNYGADRVLTNVDPKSTVLEGDVEITEDDGISRGKTYTIKLTGNVRGKDTVFATTTLTMN